MAKSIEPEVKDWFAQALSQHKTKYCIEQGTLNIEIENVHWHRWKQIRHLHPFAVCTRFVI